MGKVCHQRSDFNPKTRRPVRKRGAVLRRLLLGAGGVELQLFEAVPVETVECFRREVIV